MDRRRQFDDWNITYQAEEVESEKEGTNSAFTFLCVLLLLTGFGLIMLYSASYDEAIRHALPHYYYVARQAMFAIAGLVVGLAIRFVPVRWFSALSVPMLLLSLMLMLLTLFSPLGSTVLGARRWLRFGPLSLQPVEVVKFSVVLFLAFWFRDEKRKGINRFLVPVLVMLGFSALIILQRDFSSTVVFIGLCLAMFVAGGIGFGHLALLIASLAVPTAVIMLSAPYRVRRIASFLMPGLDDASMNYQVSTALKAIKAGGFFGVGLGKGTYKLGLLPEVQNDFIFANMCEETGFVWVMFLMAMFVIFAILGYKTYQRAKRQDLFLSYLAFGYTTMIVWQAVINIAVVVGLLPPTGIPLPFFSQGGTNLFVVLVSSSLIYRVMLICSGRIPLEKSNLSKDERRLVEFPTSGEEPRS
ncbi:MAG: putative lipid II flippase FtsW [Sphaerochaeta sp.]|jgi:cell division protein FtsW|nr:putative lipid II flippase FtsW [Sphaerochaeta sp.]MCI2103736.1 putative lipid II flippase FtsW [Sphaerochaeta sp.]MCI2129055.1 putative lipid II flippase FtsW [Sphaerochaeta sp.]